MDYRGLLEGFEKAVGISGKNRLLLVASGRDMVHAGGVFQSDHSGSTQVFEIASMWTFAKRVVPPIALLLAGLGSLLYGTLWHRPTILTEEEVEVEIVIPTPFGPPTAFDESLPGDQWGADDLGFTAEEDTPLQEWEGPEANPFEPGTSSPEDPFDSTDDSENPFESGSEAQQGESDSVNPFENPFSSGADSPVDAPSIDQEPSFYDTQADVEQYPPFEGPPLDNPMDGAPDSFGLTEPKTETITDTKVTSKEEPEWVLVREVTFGGVRLANGHLKRTYSGQPPALCPT